MAVITRYVDAGSSGGDGTTQNTSGTDAAYASLSAALAAESTDLVTAGDRLVIICGGSDADSVAVADNAIGTIPGMTTSATNDITIQADDNHNGVWDDTIYRLDNNGYRAPFSFPTNLHVTVVGLQINQSRNASGGAGGNIIRARSSGAGSGTLDRCLLRHTGSNVDGTGKCNGIITESLTGDFVLNVRNCIIYDPPRNGFQMRMVDTSGGGALHALNCTVINAGANGFNVAARSSSGGVGSLRNCIAQDCGINDFGSGGSGASGTWTQTNNLSKDATATSTDTDSGATSIINTTLTFRDAAAYDYHLAATDTAAIDAGVDLSGTFTHDIDGVARTGTFDIGADQFVAAVAAGPALVGTVAQSQTTSVAHTLAAGRGNRIVFGLYGAEDALDTTPTGVTYGGQAMTLLGSHKNTGHNTCVYSFYILEADLPANGTNTFDASSISNNAYDACTVLCFDNLAQTTESDVLIGDLAIAPSYLSTGGDITVATNNDLVLFQGHTRDGETFSSTTMDVAAFYDIGAGAAMQMYGYALTPVAGEFTATVTGTTVIAYPATIISSWAQLAGSAGSAPSAITLRPSAGVGVEVDLYNVAGIGTQFTITKEAV